MRIANRPVLSRTAHALVLSAAASLALLLMLVTGSDTIVQAQTPDTPTPETPQGPGDWDGVENLTPIEGERNPPMYPNMDSNLNRIVEQVQTGQFSAQAAAANAPIHREESVAVTLYITEGYAQDVWDYLEQSGASPRNIGADYIEAYIPVSLLPEASTQEGVISIRTIIPPEPAQGTVVSEGAAAHGAPAWHAAGLKGQSVKIGIIDTGFEGFQSLMGTELPSSVEARCYTDVGVFTFNLADCDTSDGGKHGTAVTEALFDIAPGAAYYISNPPTQGDLQATVAWMIDHDVDVINMSETWTWDGPGDGTSPYSSSPLRSVDTAVAGGITWINNAGNNAEHTWFGSFSNKNDSNYWHNFEGDDECNNVELEAGERIRVQLRWDSRWGGATRDLDIYLVPSGGGIFTADDAVALSENEQSGGIGHDPYEFFSFTPYTDGNYCLAIWHYGGSQPSWIQLQTWGGDTLEYHTSNGSIGNPSESANSGLLAVGAANWRDTSEIDYYSSRGPTPDDRIKPDIVGASGGRTVTWRSEDNPEGYFGGTSSSAPHIAGLSALVTQRFPDYTPQQVTNYIKTHADARGSVPNNTWGYGFAKLAASDAATPTPEPTVTPEPTPEPTATPEPTPPADPCVENLDADSTIQGSWSDGCPSESRSGSYASYFTFSLTESSDVTIGIESSVDTYLYLREGAGRDGSVLHENDDIVSGNTNSEIQETLSAGTYTIEATTYDAGATGDFTLTVSGLPAAVEPSPTPEPTATPEPTVTPEPTPTPPVDSCVETVSADGALSGSWDSDCASESRAGSYASYYAFTLSESAEVTITFESSVDTYLYLREGAGRDGSVLHENDDHDAAEFTLTSSTDSGISESLDAGDYTIEATTYDADTAGDFSLSVSGLPATVEPQPTPEPTVTIRFGDLNWSSAMLQNRIAQYIAEKGYGYSTSVEFGATLPLFQGLRGGDIDVLMEVWLPNQEQSWEEALAEGAVSSPGSSLGTDWQSAFVIPKYLQEQYPDLDSVEDLKEEQYKSLFATDETDGKARLVSCVIGWACEVINAKQIEGYGLSEHVHIFNPGDGAALNADLTEAYENGEPWLGYQWGTNDPALQFDLVRLEEPAYSDECWSTTMACAYEDSTILIAVNAGLSESAADFVDVLTEWDFNVDGVYKPVVRWQADNPEANTEDAALWWLRGNNDAWSEWVTADASAAIQEALDSDEIPDGWPEAPSITPEPTPTPTPTPEPPADSCVGTVSGDGTVSGSWSSDCASEGRSGSYASYHTFTLTETADVTITAESGVDTYLFLREGAGRDGSVVDENDDHDTSEFSLASTTDSGISESLDAGSYTIEVTTYTAGETGEFTLTISGLPAALTPQPSMDRAALVALYNATNGDNWTDKENWLSDEPLGEWQGVTTDDDGRVTQIRLWENNLIGSIPADLGNLTSLNLLALHINQLNGSIPMELGNLSNLTELALWENQLSGEIPEELGNLSNLTELQLCCNELSGEIPAELGNLASLVVIGLDENQLNGEIPEELGNLSNLTELALWENQLSGEIPSELGGLANLQRLYLGENDLSGEIPAALGSLASLEELDLRDNELSGGIPSELGNLSNLERLYLTRNQLSGEIPTELSSLPNLEELALGGNQLSGSIPAELGSLASLIELYLWGNEFSGDIPSELGSLSSLTVLRLGGNQLSGEIPAELGNLASLVVIGLDENQLNGEIPEELGNLSNLTELALWENQLSGEIPSELGGLANLQRLYLGENDLSGEIPAALGSLASLEELDLRDNELSGGIPSELGNLSNLERLYLTRNQLSGEIPTELSSLPNLEELALGGNQLSGSIPAELGSLASLIELYLWGNEFSGDIPSELGSLSSLTVLRLGGNQLSGEIPAELGNLASLVVIGLDENQLNGEIPEELGNLSNLTELALWENQLSGEIPSELGGLANLQRLYLGENDLSGEIPAALGSLASLEELDLRDNELSGGIPSELGNLSNLERLYLTRNQLSGEIPTELSSLPNLEELALGGNQLSGSIPAELGSLASLIELYLWGNEFSGDIPSELGSLSSLTVLHLGGNQLSGEIPEELGNLSNLSELYLYENQLSGEIPEELGNLSNLTELQLCCNELSGEIPAELGNLASLVVIGLDENQLNGEIPEELGNLSNLTELALWENQLSGEIPSELGGLANLQRLYLGENDLSGEIPTELSSLPNLEELALGGNQLSGSIPAELGSLASLIELYLWGNEFSGDIPSELGSLSSLTVLHLGGNQLSGEIPAELGNLASLVVIGLDENQLSGEIPEELGNLSNLSELYLYENQLSGEIPEELGNLSNLTELQLCCNELSGEIPSELGRLANLTVLNAWNNQLSGELPSELGNLSNLTLLDLPENQFSGEIPSELGNLSNLTVLGLWGNELSGEIPSELGDLDNLQRLDLGDNELSGEIPNELGRLADLEYLNLGRNQLSGEIPSELGRLDNLDQLYLYNNQLSGDVPSELLAKSGLRIMALYGNQLSGDVPEHTEERAILTTLYNSTGGTDWNENENWGSAEPVFTWSRVLIDTSGHVTALWLHENQLSGEIPSELSNLEDLEHLFLAGNQLSGCIPVGLQDVPGNDFGDLDLEFCSDEN